MLLSPSQKKINDPQTDGTQHHCHIQIVSSYNNLNLDQRMLMVTLVSLDE